jgi:primosomal protein N' (replication factor Y)
MKIVSVIPLKKSLLKGDLTYFTSLNVEVGNIVYVPVRNNKTLSLVTSVEELEEAKTDVKKMDFNLKKVLENKGASIFSKEFLDSVFSTSKYFAQNINASITSLIPNIFIEEYDKIAKIKKEDSNLLAPSQSLRAEKLLLQYPLLDRISMYKTLVRESFARGKSVFMVLPTEFDIDKFTAYLSKGVEQFTFSMHSGMAEKKVLSMYEKIMASSHPVLIIGTPPFLCIPKKNIGTVILEHENSGAYRMIRKPHFDLRTFAEVYASKNNSRFIMADECLRFETIGRKDLDNMTPLHPLSYRVDFSGEIITENPNNDSQNLFHRGNKDLKFKIFSDQNLEEVKHRLEKKENIFVFSLRKGLATMTVCKDCGEIVSCEKCGTPLVLYTSHQGKKRMFVCNRCVTEKDGDIACVSCKGWNLVPLGIGADTVSAEIKKIFPKIKVFQLDKESAKTAAGARKIIKEFENTKGSVLVGTEMAFFYLKEKVPLSIIAAFDSLWSIPNFKMSERILQILLSISSMTKEKLIIQTKNENDAIIKAFSSKNMLSFVREELEDRLRLDYPPYKRFIKISHLGDKDETLKARNMLKEGFAEYSPEIFSGFVAKLKGEYLTNALIKMDIKKWSLPELSNGASIDENLSAKLLVLQPTFGIQVDPEDLL